MIRFILLSVMVILLQGCFNASPKPHQGTETFSGENTYIMFALEAENTRNYASAAKLFMKVYKKTNNTVYLYRALSDWLSAKDYSHVLKAASYYSAQFESDSMLKRYRILALINLGRYSQAKKEALLLVKQTDKNSDYILVSDVYIKQKRYREALAYLESAYAANHSVKLLDRIATILFVNLQKPKDAIAYLETYVHINGCTDNVCKLLAGFYSNENNISGMLSTYMRMYNTNPSKKIANEIINIYEYTQNYPQLMLFLQRCHCNNKLLLSLYVYSNIYNKASEVAKELYKKTDNANYLAQSAMFKYESIHKKITNKQLKSIIDELKQAVSYEPKAIYLNYLGYIMIKHNIDIKQGITYVQQALKQDPGSAYYIDSLALGYYKLHKCQKAYRLIEQVKHDIGLGNNEIKDHYRLINSCKEK